MLGLPIASNALSAAANDPSAKPRPGLYVGSLERRAWIVTGRRSKEDPEIYLVQLGLDEERIDIADLELDVEEYLAGELVAARRIRLADLELPATSTTPGQLLQICVRLPSIGASVSRQIRLYDMDGLWLDGTDRVGTVEQINLTIDFGTSRTQTTIGHAERPDLTARLRSTDAVEKRFRSMLEAGLPGRIIDDPAASFSRLRGALGRARRELLVLDPYFGWKGDDWTVIDDVDVPVRVLTGHGRYDRRTGTLRKQCIVPPPPGIAPRTSSVEVRSWRAEPPPWHDRFYLWESGGLSVGTSPSGLGDRLARLDRIGAVEAEGWTKHFELWWNDPLAQRL
jgi:hypothetical protein